MQYSKTEPFLYILVVRILPQYSMSQGAMLFWIVMSGKIILLWDIFLNIDKSLIAIYALLAIQSNQ